MVNHMVNCIVSSNGNGNGNGSGNGNSNGNGNGNGNGKGNGNCKWYKVKFWRSRTIISEICLMDSMVNQMESCTVSGNGNGSGNDNGKY